VLFCECVHERHMDLPSLHVIFQILIPLYNIVIQPDMRDQNDINIFEV